MALAERAAATDEVPFDLHRIDIITGTDDDP